MEARITAEGLEQLKGKLRRVERQAVRQADTDAVAQNIQAIILMRTQRGQFLPGKTGKGYTPGHARKRQKRGLQIVNVDLFMGQVGVLESIRARSNEESATKVTIETGYITGLSEARAAEIGRYLDTDGAGINRLTYPHIGLTDSEESGVLRNLEQRIQNHLNNTLK